MTEAHETGVQSWLDADGAILRIRLCRPPGNVLDLAVLEGLRQAFGDPPGKVVAAVLDHEGPHFSYGSSIEEHRPGVIERALPAFHDLLRHLAGFPLPLACAVRGQCLGGGLELAAFCDVLFAGSDATFGLPEVRLGVFAPVGSLILAERVGEGAARDLLLSGRSIPASEALRLGLVQSVSADPAAAALSWVRNHLLALSPSTLPLATRAARMMFMRRVLPALDAVEGLYLNELMRHPDAAEGVAAFLGKRAPRWTPR